MNDTAAKVNYIAEYLSSYQAKVATLNSLGLFDEAKHFEIFAIQLARLWLNKDFKNCNETRSNEPYVDLVSEEGDIYIQVSADSTPGTKIRKTIEKIEKSEFKKTIKKLYFILLNDYNSNYLTLEKEYDYFSKENIITPKCILAKAQEGKGSFLDDLYGLVYKNFSILETELQKYDGALKRSSFDVEQLNATIGEGFICNIESKIEELEKLNSKNTFILGPAGIGKTAFCKLYLQGKSCLYIRAEVFAEERNLNNIWFFDLDTIFSYLGEKSLSIFIDSLESLSDCLDKNNNLQYFLRVCEKYPTIKVYMTCREINSSSFFTIQQQFNCKTLYINKIAEEEINSLKEKYPFIGDFENILGKELFRTPWYLNMILAMSGESVDVSTVRDFRQKIWDKVVCKKGSHASLRRDTISRIIAERASKKSVYVFKEDYDLSAISELISDDILIENEDKTKIRIKHDIFEDIFFEKEIDKIYELSKHDNNIFWTKLLELGECIYRRYQIWVESKMFEKTGNCTLLYDIILSVDSPKMLVENTIAAIVKSNDGKNFFEELKGYLETQENDDLLKKFIKITNLYAFQINKNNVKDLTLYPLGQARKFLIEIIYKYHIYDQVDCAKDIIKLIENYSAYSGEKAPELHFDAAKNVLMYYINEKFSSISRSSKYTALRNAIKLLYRFSSCAKEEIIQIWTKLKSWLKSTNDDERWCAIYILQDTLEYGNFELIRNMTGEICDLADFFWRYEYHHQPEDEEIFMYRSREDASRFYAWGLSGEYSNYVFNPNHNRLFLINSFVYALLQIDLVSGIKFIVEFINECVNIFEKSNPNTLSIYSLIIEDVTKSFYGHESFWMAFRGGTTFPEIIPNMLMCLEYYLIEGLPKILQLKDCRPYYIIFREYVFAHANNIFFFPIIFSLAEKYYAQLQDYAIPLLTNPNFIIFDLHRKVQENSFSGLNCIGLMHKNDNKLLKDFNNQEFRQRTLQDYAITLQFNFQYRGKVLEIIDKLYSDIGNEDAVALLNIQKMDLRKAVIYETDNPGEYIVEGKFEGKPKEIVEENAKIQEPIKKLIFEINSFIDDTTNCERADLNKLTAILDSIILYDITQISINGLNNHVKILILLALANQELDQEPRERYIRYMLGFLDGLIDMDQLAVPGMNDIFQKIKIFEKNEYIAIWKQLDFDISEELKEVIRYKIFQILLQGEKTDTLIGITRYYLSENSILEAELRKCLFLIAEDECDKRVAYYKKERIKKYQYDYFERFRTFYKGDAEVDECKIVSKEFVDDNLCYAISNYNLSVLNAKDYNILEKLYSGLKLHYEKHDHRDRINYYSSYNLHCCFFRNLIIDKQHADKVLDLLFKEPINISHDLVKFIQRIFEPLSVKFFDGYNNREIRNHIIYILGKLKKYLSTESLKKAFSNCALLTCSEYAGDWSLCKTNYLPSDKLFINKLLLEYGKYSPEQAIRNIYQLQPKELLPEVLIGLNSFVNHNTENMATTVLKSKQCLIEILSIALIEYKKELQNNKKYEEAFEGILSFLISLSIPEAAILLDDYRVY